MTSHPQPLQCSLDFQGPAPIFHLLKTFSSLLSPLWSLTEQAREARELTHFATAFNQGPQLPGPSSGITPKSQSFLSRINPHPPTGWKRCPGQTRPRGHHPEHPKDVSPEQKDRTKAGRSWQQDGGEGRPAPEPWEEPRFRGKTEPLGQGNLRQTKGEARSPGCNWLGGKALGKGEPHTLK